MPRHPEWFERLGAIEDAVRGATEAESLGSQEIGAAFRLGYRDSVRVLHQFGGRTEADSLRVDRRALLTQLEAIRAGDSYRAFLRKRDGIAAEIERAREESAARRLRVRPAIPQTGRIRLGDLPPTVRWRRDQPADPGRFEIQYDDGADLLWQLAEFLAAAAADREEFFRGTEPAIP